MSLSSDLFLYHFYLHLAPKLPRPLLLQHQWLQVDNVCRYPIICKEKPTTIKKNAISKAQCILLRMADYLVNLVVLYVPLTPQLSIPISQEGCITLDSHTDSSSQQCVANNKDCIVDPTRSSRCAWCCFKSMKNKECGAGGVK